MRRSASLPRLQYLVHATPTPVWVEESCIWQPSRQSRSFGQAVRRQWEQPNVVSGSGGISSTPVSFAHASQVHAVLISCCCQARLSRHSPHKGNHNSNSCHISSSNSMNVSSSNNSMNISSSGNISFMSSSSGLLSLICTSSIILLHPSTLANLSNGSGRAKICIRVNLPTNLCTLLLRKTHGLWGKHLQPGSKHLPSPESACPGLKSPPINMPWTAIMLSQPVARGILPGETLSKTNCGSSWRLSDNSGKHWLHLHPRSSTCATSCRWSSRLRIMQPLCRSSKSTSSMTGHSGLQHTPATEPLLHLPSPRCPPPLPLRRNFPQKLSYPLMSLSGSWLSCLVSSQSCASLRHHHTLCHFDLFPCLSALTVDKVSYMYPAFICSWLADIYLKKGACSPGA